VPFRNSPQWQQACPNIFQLQPHCAMLHTPDMLFVDAGKDFTFWNDDMDTLVENFEDAVIAAYPVAIKTAKLGMSKELMATLIRQRSLGQSFDDLAKQHKEDSSLR
jgi:hypothetical protein